jgi:hypothetical protein
MEQKPSLLEVAIEAFHNAERAFAENPDDATARRVEQAQSLVATQRDHERRNGGPIRPPS